MPSRSVGPEPGMMITPTVASGTIIASPSSGPSGPGTLMVSALEEKADVMQARRMAPKRIDLMADRIGD